MSEAMLPDSIRELVTELQLVELEWQNRTLQLPRFSVYAIIDKPVFDYYVRRDGRKMGLILQDKYTIPVLDPFLGDVSEAPAHAVIISHCRGNRFGLFGYPANRVRDDVQLPARHAAVPSIVSTFA